MEKISKEPSIECVSEINLKDFTDKFYFSNRLKELGLNNLNTKLISHKELSEQVFTPTDGDTTKLGRFQLRNMAFNFNDTGTFNVAVKSTGRDIVNHRFTGRLLGDSNNFLGYSAIVDDEAFKVGVQSQAKETDITITNDTHLPCVFQSVEYEAWATLRNRRL